MKLKDFTEYLDKIIFKEIHYYIMNDNNEYSYWEKITGENFTAIKSSSPQDVKQLKSSYFKRASLEQLSTEIYERPSKLKTRAALFALAIVSLTTFFSFFLFSPETALFLNAIILIVSVAALIYYFEVNNYFIYLRYAAESGQEIPARKPKILSESDFFWHVDSIIENKDLRSFSGSKELYKRSLVKSLKKPPHFINSNIDIACFKYNKKIICFFPDFVLFKNDKLYLVLPYGSLYVKYTETPFNEYEFSPDDSHILDHTWLHPNKDGTRDERFKNNPGVPIMLYSEILISTAEHINIHFLVSNIKNAYIFSEFLKPYVQYYSEERFTFEKEKKEKTEEREKKTRTREEQEATAHNYNYREWVRPDKKSGSNKDPGNNEIVRRSQNLWAFKILGLSKSANQKEIKKAYFALVKIYHPDKHAHKNPEIFKDAEEKLKVINEAYESLKK